MKEPIFINFLSDSKADVKVTELRSSENKYSFKYAKSVLTKAPQMEMLRQVYGGSLAYLEFITLKTRQPITLDVKVKQACVAFIYVIEGVLRFSLPGSSDFITVVEGQNFVMLYPDGGLNWPIEKGESVVFFFILQPQFVLDIQEDYPEMALMIQQLMAPGITFALSKINRTSSETKRTIKKISSLKANTRLMQEQVILQATSKLITQYIFELQNPMKIPYRSNKEIGYAVQDHIISEVEKGIIPQVTKISRYFKIEAKTIRRICLKVFNMNTQDVIIDAQMKIAHSLIKNGIMVKEVAFRLGYTEPAAFSRAFKKYFGHSPSNEKKNENDNIAGLSKK